jgi:hypothetical protein
MKNATHKTISDRLFRITSNKSKRTFTIVTESAKYRTLPMSKEEFNHADIFWSGNDWQQFLNTDSYYKVK